MNGFTPDQIAFIRTMLIEHSIGATMAGQIARRHYTLFYAECHARRDELAAATPAARDQLLLAIAAEAHEQELAERQEAERAADPEGLSAIERLHLAFGRPVR